MRRTVRKRPALITALALGSVAALGSGVADAHFRLVAPPNWVMQSSDGSPQKTGPCGNEAPQTPSNVTTPFRPGDTITIQLSETVYHPGHYRVALAVNAPSELPAPPAVTAGSTACGSAVIQSTPVYPVLADGMLPHTSPLSGQQSFQVKLPTNVTCTSCTLQILEFMAEHSAPCFYYHCAKISIQADGGTGPSDGGVVDASRDSAGGAGGSGATGGSAGTGATGGATGTGATGGAAGTGATGGATGTGATGGATGTGAAGGATGTGATGGSTGSGATGGATGTGATGGSTGTGATGGTGSGGSGATGGAGGASGSGTGRGGTDSDASPVTGGCSCSIADANAQSLSRAGAWLALVLVAVRRRRKHP